jgi:transcriptional regulator with XRE-family HTH domain
MAGSRLTALVGSTLLRERERRRLTQHQLAALAGVSQGTIARIERGERHASLPMVERLLAALGVQLTLGVEPLDAHVDAEIATLVEAPLAERVARTDIDRVQDRLTVPYVFDGPTAALLQGAPVPTGAVHVALAWGDADAITEWLEKNYAQRWHAKWEVFGYLRVDPRDPGDHRWRTIPGEIQARMCDALPPAIRVMVADREYPVVPLVEVAIDDPGTARLLDRYRRRATR